MKIRILIISLCVISMSVRCTEKSENPSLGNCVLLPDAKEVTQLVSLEPFDDYNLNIPEYRKEVEDTEKKIEVASAATDLLARSCCWLQNVGDTSMRVFVGGSNGNGQAGGYTYQLPAGNVWQIPTKAIKGIAILKLPSEVSKWLHLSEDRHDILLVSKGLFCASSVKIEKETVSCKLISEMENGDIGQIRTDFPRYSNEGSTDENSFDFIVQNLTEKPIEIAYVGYSADKKKPQIYAGQIKEYDSVGMHKNIFNKYFNVLYVVEKQGEKKVRRASVEVHPSTRCVLLGHTRKPFTAQDPFAVGIGTVEVKDGRVKLSPIAYCN